MVQETIGQTGERVGVITRVARQLGVGIESLRGWVRQAEIDGGRRPCVPSEERRCIAELERENRELRRSAGCCRSPPFTYYAARSRPPSARALWDAELKVEIARVYEAKLSVYGAEKLWRQLQREGIRVGRVITWRS